MGWLKNLFGERPPQLPYTEGQNPIHAWLDAYHIPWQESRGDMIARYGVTHANRGFEAVEIDVPEKPIKGLIRPLYFQLSDYFSPHVPASELIGDAYYLPDEDANIRRVAKELSAFLGPAEVEDHLNTLRVIWTFDRASVRLLAWPREKQRPRSSWEKADDRDPRLKLGCYIKIHTGFLPNPTEAERAQFETFVPVCSLPARRGVGTIDSWNVNQNELEFIREPTGFSNIADVIGTSSDRSALVFRTADLFIFQMASVQAIYVERTQPAKGPGGSVLQIEVLTDYQGVSVKKVTVCESSGADDLNDTGELIANAVQKPLKLSPYYSDC